MPKQTSPKSSRRQSGPYPQQPPPRTRSQTTSTSTSMMMNYTMPAAAPAPPHTQHQPGWQHQQPMAAIQHHMPPPQRAGYPRPLTATEQQQEQHRQRQRQPSLPTSPVTPTTPGASTRRQSTSNPSSSLWTEDDDDILLRARAQSHGWGQIQKDHFPSKTSNACRKRYERLIAKRRGSDWDGARIEKVVRQYAQMREQTWRPLADAVGENWEDVEKLCLERGTRTLLVPLGQRDMRREGSERESPASHDSHDDERVSISNLIQ